MGINHQIRSAINLGKLWNLWKRRKEHDPFSDRQKWTNQHQQLHVQLPHPQSYPQFLMSWDRQTQPISELSVALHQVLWPPVIYNSINILLLNYHRPYAWGERIRKLSQFCMRKMGSILILLTPQRCSSSLHTKKPKYLLNSYSSTTKQPTKSSSSPWPGKDSDSSWRAWSRSDIQISSNQQDNIRGNYKHTSTMWCQRMHGSIMRW